MHTKTAPLLSLFFQEKDLVRKQLERERERERERGAWREREREREREAYTSSRCSLLFFQEKDFVRTQYHCFLTISERTSDRRRPMSSRCS